jgi:hypothetical protein
MHRRHPPIRTQQPENVLKWPDFNSRPFLPRVERERMEPAGQNPHFREIEIFILPSDWFGNLRRYGPAGFREDNKKR